MSSYAALIKRLRTMNIKKSVATEPTTTEPAQAEPNESETDMIITTDVTIPETQPPTNSWANEWSDDDDDVTSFQPPKNIVAEVKQNENKNCQHKRKEIN